MPAPCARRSAPRASKSAHPDSEEGACRGSLGALLLLLIPAAAGAQVTSGTSPAGLFYEASGSGEPVVLIHAFSVDRRMWAPQIAALEGRFQVIRYDLRGHGKSAPPSAPYAPHEDLRSVLDALGVAEQRSSVCPRATRSPSTSRWCIRSVSAASASPHRA